MLYVFPHWIDELNRRGKDRRPTFFLVSAWGEVAWIVDPDEAALGGVHYDIGGQRNPGGIFEGETYLSADSALRILEQPDRELYEIAFLFIRKAGARGETWLANLTASTKCLLEGRFQDAVKAARAPYRLYVTGAAAAAAGPDRDSAAAPKSVAVFSPESFVSIRNETISTRPMKGTRFTSRSTIGADAPDPHLERAAASLAADAKEAAEHVTIVDLLRNDLGRVAERIAVPRFRYAEHIETPEGWLTQTSSLIEGKVSSMWQDGLGTLLSELVPPGSVTGAPKKRTVELLRHAEETLLGHFRGWYAGIFGLFDGTDMETAVSIRFMEDRGPDPSGKGRVVVFKSGGGLTQDSDPNSEYRELLDKVRIPFGPSTSPHKSPSSLATMQQSGSASGPPLLLETLRISGGNVCNIEFHIDRMRTSLRTLGIASTAPDSLEDYLISLLKDIRPDAPGPETEGARFKCRVVYGANIASVEISPYVMRRPKLLVCVDAGDLDYRCKFADRSALDSLKNSASPHAKRFFAGRGDLTFGAADWDILMCKNGLILDAGYANIVYENGNELITPSGPLLAGTRRAAYIASGRVRPASLRLDMLNLRDNKPEGRIYLVNAMIDLEDMVCPDFVIVP